MWRALLCLVCVGLSTVSAASDGASHTPSVFFPGADAFRGEWYAQQLRALGETPLSVASAPAGPVIRFTWLRTFHHPVVLRLERSPAGQWQLRTKIGSGAGGYDPGTLEHDTTVSISPESAEGELRQLTTDRFWTLPSQLPPIDRRTGQVNGGFDGAQWILEVRDGTRYHFLDRWGPKAGIVHELGRHLMTLSGTDFGPVY